MDQATALLPRQALEYDGRIGELYRIFVVNLLLTVITIGIYRFWAITRWRRYFWSHMAFQEERFEYTGRGGELFLGALLALGILTGLSIERTAGGVGAADRDRRGVAGDQRLARQSGSGVRRDAGKGDAAVRRNDRRHLCV